MSGVDIAGLVEKLREVAGLQESNWRRHREVAQRWAGEAADALLAQAAEVEKLTARLAFSLDEGTSWAVKAGLATRQRDKALAALKASEEALSALVNARALKGVREVVAGWNGEGRADGPYQRHDARLGATLPKTNCGAVYELDEAMTAARKALENSKAPLADATNNPPSDPGTEQREAGR